MSARSSAKLSNRSGGGGFIQNLEPRICFSNIPPVIPPDFDPPLPPNFPPFLPRPAAPRTTTATALSSTTIRLDWQDLAVNETGYMIFRSTDQVNFIKVATTGQNAQSWTDTTLGPNTTYYYKLKARADTANSTYSKVASATTLSPSDDVTASFDLANGQLIVRGTFGNDTMTVSTTTSTVVATVNGASKIFNKLDVQRISVLGLSGNDSVQILSGVIAVNVSGGEGDDTLLGSANNDRIDGGPGDDSIKGLDGDDSLTGGEGNDTIYGQLGNDYIQGGFGNDKLVGGDGNDSILGNDGNDRLYGQAGLDTLVGGGGSNYIQPD